MLDLLALSLSASVLSACPVSPWLSAQHLSPSPTWAQEPWRQPFSAGVRRLPQSLAPGHPAARFPRTAIWCKALFC